MDVNEWAQLDMFGQIASRRKGSAADMKAVLTKGITDQADWVDTADNTDPKKRKESVYLPGRQVRVKCRMLILTTPWGKYRLIPARLA
jgi:GH35 family endo-1,4-beta-xylanase